MNAPYIPPHRPDAGYRCLHDFALDAERASHRETRLALYYSVGINLVLSVFLLAAVLS